MFGGSCCSYLGEKRGIISRPVFLLLLARGSVVISDASYIDRKVTLVTVLYEPNIIRMSYPGTVVLLRRFSVSSLYRYRRYWHFTFVNGALRKYLSCVRHTDLGALTSAQFPVLANLGN